MQDHGEQAGLDAARAFGDQFIELRLTDFGVLDDTGQRPVGFDVTYRLNGKQDTIRLDHDPGPQIPVQDGKLVLNTQNKVPK